MDTSEELLKVPYKIEVNYEMDYGRISKFFKELRDNGKIFGTKCPQCGIVYCPPSSDCPKCWVPTEWVEVGQQGTLLAYTIIGIPALWLNVKAPYPMGLIKLDGADTGLLHFLNEVEPDKIKAGMRLEAVLKKREERGGYITDIAYFRPIQKNFERKTTVYLVEWNADIDLSASGQGYAMESGKIVLDCPAEKLKNNEDVREFYSGLSYIGKRKVSVK